MTSETKADLISRLKEEKQARKELATTQSHVSAGDDLLEARVMGRNWATKHATLNELEETATMVADLNEIQDPSPETLNSLRWCRRAEWEESLRTRFRKRLCQTIGNNFFETLLSDIRDQFGPKTEQFDLHSVASRLIDPYAEAFARGAAAVYSEVRAELEN